MDPSGSRTTSPRRAEKNLVRRRATACQKLRRGSRGGEKAGAKAAPENKKPAKRRQSTLRKKKFPEG